MVSNRWQKPLDAGKGSMDNVGHAYACPLPARSRIFATGFLNERLMAQ